VSRPTIAWNDRLLEWLEALRWPLVVTLTVIALVSIAGLHLVEWSLGGTPPGTIDPLLITTPLYPVGILLLIALQNRIALDALGRFRQATDLDDRRFAEIGHELTHQPARGALVSALMLGLVGVVTEVSREDAAARSDAYPIAWAFLLLMTFISYAPAGPWLVRGYRLLRRVDGLHREARRIDLLRPEPLHAFSTVTAFVGASFMVITTFSIATDPTTHQTTSGLMLTAVMIVAAVACFVVPLYGMHRRLQAERSRMDAEVAQRIEATLARLYAHVDEDRAGASELDDRLSALLATRDLIGRLGTWPWRSETPRLLFTTLLLPIAVWLATWAVERTFE
jgi:hypothetical protein